LKRTDADENPAAVKNAVKCVIEPRFSITKQESLHDKSRNCASWLSPIVARLVAASSLRRTLSARDNAREQISQHTRSDYNSILDIVQGTSERPKEQSHKGE
jgi:hypothetical protein